MIELQNVSRYYGDKLAVDRLDLKVPAGTLFAFLGPNGAGKTTTIKMMVGLLRPSAGQVRICGHDIVLERRIACSHLGYIPDQPFLYDKLTAREFLEFVGGMHGMSRPLIRDRIDREVARFELASFVDHLTETCSHGMKQRIVFASALLHDPSVLVVDEPMVGLDPRSARLVKDLLREHARQGMTIFMSTHLLDVAEEIADVIGIVDHGHLVREGAISAMRIQGTSIHQSLEQIFLSITANGQAPQSPRSEIREAVSGE